MQLVSIPFPCFFMGYMIGFASSQTQQDFYAFFARPLRIALNINAFFHKLIYNKTWLFGGVACLSHFPMMWYWIYRDEQTKPIIFSILHESKVALNDDFLKSTRFYGFLSSLDNLVYSKLRLDFYVSLLKIIDIILMCFAQKNHQKEPFIST